MALIMKVPLGTNFLNFFFGAAEVVGDFSLLGEGLGREVLLRDLEGGCRWLSLDFCLLAGLVLFFGCFWLPPSLEAFFSPFLGFI